MTSAGVFHGSSADLPQCKRNAMFWDRLKIFMRHQYEITLSRVFLNHHMMLLYMSIVYPIWGTGMAPELQEEGVFMKSGTDSEALECLIRSVSSRE